MTVVTELHDRNFLLFGNSDIAAASAGGQFQIEIVLTDLCDKITT